MQLSILTTRPEKDYELLDSGDGEKLERYGKFVISRPDPQALWPKHLEQKVWAKADAEFKRADTDSGWQVNSQLPASWPIAFGNLKFNIKLSAFKHTGLFPEQLPNWQWLESIIKKNTSAEVLNLFGYTGGATLAAASAGASVCHVDSSKTAVAWAAHNAELSNLKNKPIRWIVEDAVKFVQREFKRGHKYSGIILDPPAFGRGAKGEVWKIEDDFLQLLSNCFKLLSNQPLFFLLNGYAAGYSALVYQQNLQLLLNKFGGQIEAGELTITESQTNRLLSAGIFARWRSHVS